MNWTVMTVGKPALAWAKDAVGDYSERINKVTSLKLSTVKDCGRTRNAEVMLAQAGKSVRIVLDERGRSLRSLEMAQWIRQKELSGTKHVCLLIGGAEGHCDVLRSSAHECWSLSSLTLQHELALVVLMEQIYRAYSILRGTPYHRE